MGETPKNDRRRVLAAGAAALAAPELGSADPACVPDGAGPNAEYLPNVTVVTHEGRRALFYNDLLLRGTVMVNFMRIADEETSGVTANLARVQPYLGERLGRDVFLYSITTDPENDTPRALAEFARKHEVRSGWLFLTGAIEDLDQLRSRFFVDGGRPAGHAHHAPSEDCSLGMIRYGNESIGIWGAMPHRAEPEWIASRIDWITPKKVGSGPARRRGPVPGGPFPGAVASPKGVGNV